MPTFRDWVDSQFYEGFDLSGLSDEEYYELEDAYREFMNEEKNIPIES